MARAPAPIDAAATAMLGRFMGLARGDVVWAFTDLPEDEAGRLAIAAAARQGGIAVEWVQLPPIGYNGQEPPEAIVARRPAGSPVIAYTRFSLSSTAVRRRVCGDGGRFFSLAGGAEALILLDVDEAAMTIMRRRGERLQRLLNDARIARLCCGADVLTVPLPRRPARLDLGACVLPGSFASPSFEVNTVPIDDAAEGSFGALGVMPDVGLFAEPLGIDVHAGRLNPEARRGRETDRRRWRTFASSVDPRMLRVAELGFGLNHRVRFPEGGYLASESAWETVHLGIGRNLTLGGRLDAPGHLDVVMRPDQVSLDEVDTRAALQDAVGGYA
jgi:2,5-dihydroxypyridine 5,6-dioxygenase